MKILIATDGSPYGDAAVKEAGERLWPKDSLLRVLTVIENPPVAYITPGEYAVAAAQLTKEVRASMEEIARNAAAFLEDRGLEISQLVCEGSAAEEIIREAKEWGADLILVGTHGRKGISRFLLGSVAQKVAAHAPCSVEIVRKGV